MSLSDRNFGENDPWPIMEGPSEKASVHGKDSQSTELTQVGKAIASTAMLAFAGGMGYAIIDWDFRWALLAIVASITLLAIAGIYRKRG